MKKSKFMNLPRIGFLVMLVLIFNSCSNDKLKTELSQAQTANKDLQMTVDSLTKAAMEVSEMKIPSSLKPVDGAMAKVYLNNYNCKNNCINGEGIAGEYAKYLSKYNRSIMLMLAQLTKTSAPFTLFAIQVSHSGTTYTYEYYANENDLSGTAIEKVDTSLSTDTIKQQIPPCRPGNCPCSYYPPPCN